MGIGGAILAVFVGLVVLVAGGELLVRGATALAKAARVTPLVIGLTVVAFGTSAPELAVSVRASLAGQPDLAVGNVVGSNIFNVLLILGLSAVITPLAVSRRLIRFDVPLMIAASLVLAALGLDGRIGRADSAALFLGLLGYLAWTFLGARNEPGNSKPGDLPGGSRTRLSAVLGGIGLAGLGLALLVLGAQWLVTGSVALARQAGVSELIIGLTIVAAGTSLPELATSVLAAIRGEREIAVGNIVGSNIFNILGILGIAGLVTRVPLQVSEVALRFDIPVMTAVALACLPVFFTGKKIARWEGGLFLAYYDVYLAFLILSALGWSGLRTFGLVMVFFVIPLTCLTLLVSVLRNRGRTEGKTRP